MDINEIRRLLDSFEKLDKPIIETTYLEICHYSGRRFEEICSRILKYYLSPVNEHNLGDLVLKSLIETIVDVVKRDTTNKDSVKLVFSDLRYINNKVKVGIEEYAEGKRIDLIVVGENFVIGIENKINAELNNPLEAYRKLVNTYNKENEIGIVLSMRPIRKDIEKKKMEENKFYNIIYSELLSKIKNNIGFFINQSNIKTLIFLDDFIKTIENMDRNWVFDDEVSKFFFDNYDEIEKLRKSYDDFNQRKYAYRSDTLHTLLGSLKENSKVEWYMPTNELLELKMDSNGNKFGIAAEFDDFEHNPLGVFHIMIRCWGKGSWNSMKDMLNDKFPDLKSDVDNNGANLTYATIKHGALAEIEYKLIELYNKLNEIKTS